MAEKSMPALPEPSFQLVWLGDRAVYKVTKPNIGNTDVYTADQLRAYAQQYAEQRVAEEREACAELAGAFAQHWWSTHSATNKHLETTLKAHQSFCALQAAIRQRSKQ